MITPRRTRLIRVPDLRAFRGAVTFLAREMPDSGASAIVVPTRAAARLFARTLLADGAAADRRHAVLLTRAELYDNLHGRLARPPRRLSAFERDAVAQAAARHAAAGEPELSFALRPGLIAEMLRFYDELRRHSQQVKRFEELIAAPLAGADDRGAARLLVQTRFLASAFREYERRLGETDACDEHTLRQRLIEDASPRPLRRVIVTTADWIADPDGLFVADFDLLSRVPNLESIDLVCTEGDLASGLHERLHSWLPGLDEVEAAALVGEQPRVRPVLVTPSTAETELCFTLRDREDELSFVASRFRSEPSTYAAVFKHPLPYLYLAPGTLGAARVRYQTSDELPLAAEPTAAALDAALDMVESGFTRRTIVSLLRSPHFAAAHEGRSISREEVSALDNTLSRERYLGGFERLEALFAARPSPALAVAVHAARELAPLADAAPASTQIRRLLAFAASRFPAPAAEDPFAAREAQARTAIAQLLTNLADAHAAFHDPEWTVGDLATAVRRWIGEHTFAADADAEDGPGVWLIDDQAARYGDFEEMTVLGLVEHEWPERRRRNIFYGTGLLKALGWPTEKDRRAAADARFLDLLASPSARVIVSTFTLDDETLVVPSAQLDEIPRARLSRVPIGTASAPSLGPTASLAQAASPPRMDAESAADEWVRLRLSRTPGAAEEFHGRVGQLASRPWSVSALETYVGCPFKFFAQHVLRLEEEPDDEEVMDPRRQGQFVHEVFEAFFAEWQASGRRSITPDNLGEARALFAGVVERKLAVLPDAEAWLERTRLLGSPAAAGLGEAVFRMEAERPVAVVERLLEERLDDELQIATSLGVRTVRLRGKADRLDLLEDGTFRLIDYKLGWPPNKARALQLPIYALAAEQRLRGRRGRAWTLGEAAYLAFKGQRRVVPLFTSLAERDEALADAQERLADTLDAIERGEFPPTPDDLFRCETCSFSGVCRKDYV